MHRLVHGYEGHAKTNSQKISLKKPYIIRFFDLCSKNENKGPVFINTNRIKTLAFIAQYDTIRDR